ncbi:claspin isoform X2 [Ahaetulla prasina]|uniref:claspin isoform X2 n=1 Tax=Ahaetulla prasina TaxID=499056 RepID=UPI002649E6F4|nr:claspin isoform X2 [Ahaetulla prasina]
MTAAGEFHLDAQDVKTQDTSDSDSDSGQGSCEMSFRSQISKGVASVDEGDSDEEICTRKRIKCRRVLADSNSEGEDGTPEKLKVAGSNVESTKEKYNWLAVQGKKDDIPSYKAGQNSDDSDTENLLPQLQLGNPEREDKSLNRKEMKEKSSRKRKRKEEKKRKTTRQARKKEKAQEQKNGEDCPFNDSGCLLTDKELFDNGLEEEEEEEDGSPFQVENLEMSINTPEKMKTKKRKLFLESEDYNKHVTDENEGPLLKEPRKRKLKPAKLTKEEKRQLHSESQRLVREAAMTLPYHLPEAKSVQEFFKHKPRPYFQGSAMTLLKSMKTQPDSFKEDNVTGKSSINDGKEQPLQPGILDQPISGVANPLAASPSSSSAEEMEHLIGDCCEEDKQNDDSKTEFREDLNSRKEGELNEVPADSIKPPEEKLEGNIVEERETQSLELSVVPQEPTKDMEPLVEIPGDKIKKSRLDRLRMLGVDLSIKPKLCSGVELFIDLDEAEPNRELEALKERFVKHAFHTAKPKTEQRMVNVNIIRKEMMNDGKEELKADVVPVMLATEIVEDASRTKPGEKLQMLKAKLQAAMKLRRTEERQKRHALFKLDNEEVMEEEEEEEEEMSDELEEEEEEEEAAAANQKDPDGLGEMEEELEEKHLEDDKETDKESADEDETANVGLPCSVVSKPSSTESTMLLFKDNSSKIGCFLAGEKVELEEALSKRAEKPDDEDSFLLPTLAKENSHNSSFELIGSMIPSYQPCNKQMGRGGHFFSVVGTARSPSPGFFKTSFISSASKSSGKASEPSLPIEDSQDLYNVTPEEKSPVPTGGRFQFQFSLEDDTQSQLLDADGFLNVGPHRNKYQSCKSRLPLASMDENAMDANMGELFDLYSGQNQQSPNPGSGKKSDMEELLHLCSGKFPSQDSPLQASSATSKLKKKRRTKGAEPLSLFSNSFPPEREAEEKEKEEEFGEFQLLTDDHPSDSEEEDEKCKEEEEEEDEEESDQEEEGGDELEFDDEEEELKRREGRKNKFNLKDFMEDEAELSGSEGGSEDEYDGEELNEYEEDVLDEVLPADGELHDQVNKIHMKMILDDDKRQLRLYQERYLLDGDLHSDGPGRMRRFRWKNIDDLPEGDDIQKDADSGDENENHFEETEAKWRKERFEREQWFREQSTKEEEEEEDADEDSQFMRLAKKYTNKSLQKKAPSPVAVQEIKSLPRNPFESFQPGSKPQLKNGSLLNQPRAILQKLAAMSDLNPNAPRNSRNFVFQTLSPVKSEGMKEKAKPQVKRRTLPPVAVPSPKRLRLDSTSVQETRSIFQYLER